jgi:hypothetical protein
MTDSPLSLLDQQCHEWAEDAKAFAELLDTLPDRHDETMFYLADIYAQEVIDAADRIIAARTAEAAQGVQS